jgi:hypothetical protein
VLGAAPSDDRFLPARPEFAPVLVVVIAAVSDDLIGPLAGAASLAGDWADAIGEWEQLGDVVAVPAGQADRERDAVAVDDQMVL